MNIETLEEYLLELKHLNNPSLSRSPEKALDIKTKVLDALKELNLYDTQSVSLMFIPFESRFASEKDPYHKSLAMVISHLESRIQIGKHRMKMAIAEKQATVNSMEQQNKDHFDKQLAIIESYKGIVAKKDGEITKKSILIDGQQGIITSLEKKVDNKKLWWMIGSIGFWSLVVTIVVSLITIFYSLGKDNATKSDENDRLKTKNENINLKDELQKANLKIDSLKNLIPKIRPMD